MTLKSDAVATDDPCMLFPGMLAGVGLLAIWVHVRFPRLAPASLRRASVHVALSIVIFRFVPLALHEVVVRLPLPLSVVVAVSALVVPTFCYVLLSWLWLLARLRDHMGSTPRGGHPAQPGSR